MTIATLAAADFELALLELEGESVTLAPLGAAGTAPLSAILGQAAVAYLGEDNAQVHERQTELLCLRVDARAAVLAAGLTERDLLRGDKVTVASGPFTGDWTVGEVTLDEAGTATCRLHQAAVRQVGRSGTVRT